MHGAIEVRDGPFDDGESILEGLVYPLVDALVDLGREAGVE